MNVPSLADAVALLGEGVRVVGDPSVAIGRPASLADASPGSFSFCVAYGAEAARLVRETGARVVLARPSADLEHGVEGKTVVLVEDPRLAFAKLLAAFFAPEPKTGIHATAIVDPRAQVGEGVSIGPRAIIGACELGRDTTIEANVWIGDGTRIGERVIAQVGVVIGSSGWGFARDHASTGLERFPQLGGVIIGDDVELGAYACVDRGTLGDTIVERGAKIGSFTLVAHNSIVGEDAFLSPHVMLSGSVRIGARAWLAPGAIVRDVVAVGEDVTVGLGAVVVKDVPPGSTVVGVPARPHER